MPKTLTGKYLEARHDKARRKRKEEGSKRGAHRTRLRRKEASLDPHQQLADELGIDRPRAKVLNFMKMYSMGPKTYTLGPKQ